MVVDGDNYCYCCYYYCYGGLPCYWSSKGTPSSNDNEEIIFEIKHSLVLINNFSITPYRSYFQPLQILQLPIII